jgi:CRISPR/Cas system endoribonuclease Cas6 (RAMP superfamily)
MKAGVSRDTAELRQILGLAERYSPAKIKEAGFFVMVPDHVLNDSSNEFYTLTATSTNVALLAANNAAIAKVMKSEKSVKIMAYKECWEDNNFYDPRKSMKETLANRIASMKREVVHDIFAALDEDDCVVC